MSTRFHASAPMVLPLLLLMACGQRPEQDHEPVRETGLAADTMIVDLSRIPGYYEDTLPCADCPGILTQLWMRSDSTFILLQHYMDRDTLPFGTIGQWHTVNGLVTVGMTGDKPDFYRPTPEGLLLVDEAGAHSPTGLDLSLDRLADEIQDEIPRMRLAGTFTYMADAMSFRPCGSRYSWPCAGGANWTDEGEVLGSLGTAELERHYLRSVVKGGEPWSIEVECNLAMGPAMEGDGADEYVFIHRVLKEGVNCP